MGRNFDWLAHPILVLITRPAGKYASISVVDMSYVLSLADAPRWPFDGMNERGLAAGMMLVEEARSACELGMPAVSSFGIIRVILDEAASVDEAVALMDKYFVTFGDRPLHYFLADRTGASAVVEYYRGELRVFRSDRPWQVVVNSLYSGTSESNRHATCWRYAVASDRLSETDGRLDAEGVFGLLADVSEQRTVWSSSYDLTSRSLSWPLVRNSPRRIAGAWETENEVSLLAASLGYHPACPST